MIEYKKMRSSFGLSHTLASKPLLLRLHKFNQPRISITIRFFLKYYLFITLATPRENKRTSERNNWQFGKRKP